MVPWGQGQVAPVFKYTGSARAIIGYGIVCGRHTDAGGRLGPQCEKQCWLGKRQKAISKTEAMIRLKRWYLAGHCQEESWYAATRRSEHRHYGGRHLALLATDAPNTWSWMSENELDAACRLVLQMPCA